MYFRNLPRRRFGDLQSKMFPAYFAMENTCCAVSVACFGYVHPWKSSSTSEKYQLGFLLSALAFNLSNLLVFTPLTTEIKAIAERMNNSSAGAGAAAAGPSSKVRAAPAQPSEAGFKRKRGVFQKDLQHMMYGFGDDPNPLPETMALAEDIVVEYVTDLVHKAQEVATKRGKLLTEDFLFVIRKDLAKLNRCTELLSMNEELKQARKAFDTDEEKMGAIE